MSQFYAFFSGLTVSLSLILAIGAQNAFVLKQGLKNEHLFWVCLACALSDTILIILGLTGFSALVAAYPSLVNWARFLGAAFLFVYGAMHLKAALTAKNALTPSSIEKSSLWSVLAVCLALTWLNPHVYLDTVVLLGSISTRFSQHLPSFGVGAVLASWLFFFSLGYGAKLLKPVFAKPKAWQVLDVIIFIIMWFIAISLLVF